MAAQDSHPLPPPPGQQQQAYSQPQPQYYNSVPQSQQQQQQYQQQPQQYQQYQQYQQGPHHPAQKPRPRSRGFSFKSEKSHKSSGSKDKENLIETHVEKEAKRLHSKADPTLAMNEAEPAVVAATGKSQLASLRGVQHKDAFGNPIADPDRSNPTRSRWERPLDTIRSFEAAIDGGYNRKSFIRSDTESVANWNKRSSFYGGSSRFPQDSYYGGRPASTIRPNDSQFDFRQGGMNRDSLYEQGGQNGAYPSNPQYPGRQRYPRTASEPQFNNYRQGEQNIYPVPNNHRSYETVASGSGGSGLSGEAAGYQTDPTSSDNSSIERRQSPPKRQEPVNDYGIGFTQTPEYQPSAFTVGMNGQGQGQMHKGYQNAGMAAPPVPRKDGGSILRKPATNTSANGYQQRPDMGEKRKSWFTRRFSKQS